MTLVRPRLLSALLLLVCTTSQADEIRIAAASNFASGLKPLAAAFEQQHDHRLSLIFASTGKLYAQIVHGAPIDVFLAADSERPFRLEKQGRIVPGSRLTYAIGRLVLWSTQSGYVDDAGAILNTDNFRHLAIANPRLAPYGRAAKQVLEARKLWSSLRSKRVHGENIGQTFQFVASGAAELGFVAQSQVIERRQASNTKDQGSHWLVPTALHSPISQQAVQLSKGKAADEFMAFINSATGKQIIRDAGYDIP